MAAETERVDGGHAEDILFAENQRCSEVDQRLSQCLHSLECGASIQTPSREQLLASHKLSVAERQPS